MGVVKTDVVWDTASFGKEGSFLGLQKGRFLRYNFLVHDVVVHDVLVQVVFVPVSKSPKMNAFIRLHIKIAFIIRLEQVTTFCIFLMQYLLVQIM